MVRACHTKYYTIPARRSKAKSKTSGMLKPPCLALGQKITRYGGCYWLLPLCTELPPRCCGSRVGWYASAFAVSSLSPPPETRRLTARPLPCSPPLESRVAHSTLMISPSGISKVSLLAPESSVRPLNSGNNWASACQPAIIRYYIFALSLVRCVWFVCGPKSASRLLYMYEVHIKENNTCTGTSTVRYTCTLSVHGTAVRYLPYIKNTASTRAEEQMSFPFEGVGRPDAIAVLYLDMIAEKSVAMSEFFTHFAYRTLIPSLHLLPID